jgi:serine/threonine protein kinase
MELLDGPNLEQYVREYRHQRIPWREALSLLLPALEALHAIHERGYVHRDIKTGNILVTREPGRPPTAIVIDLGLVKPDRALRCATSLPTTEVGRMLCTPGYTSPEQAAGLPVDRRSDVYSMAVTLYRVLAGRLPFHEARGQPVMVVLAKHIYNEPTMLAEAAAGADIPPVIAAVIESALRKSPNDRPQTMLEFAEALRAAAASVPIMMRRRPRLHALWLAAGLGVVVTLLAMPRLASLPPVAVASGQDNTPPTTTIASATAHSVVIPVSASVTAEPDFLEDADLPIANGPESSTTAAAPLIDPPDPSIGPPAASPPAHPTRSRSRPAAIAKRGPDAAYHRAVAGRTPEVQACARVGAGGLAELTVAVDIGTSGQVSARLVGVAVGPLSRCVDAALRSTPVAAPSAPVSLTHTFTLPTTPHP